LSQSAALCAALAFELGGSAMDMAAWSPVHIATYAWLMVAWWLGERLIRRPSFRSAAALGLALAVQFLPGFPQLVLFTYQVIALRVAWAVAIDRVPFRARLLLWVAVAFVVPLGLCAVQLLPSLQIVRESLRSVPLDEDQLGGFHFEWSGL